MLRKPLFPVYLLLTAIMITIAVPPGEACAQCFGSLMLEPGFFEFDYLVRIAVHFGSAGDIPTDIICSRGRMPGEEVLEIPIWAYNLHEGVTYMEFGIESNDSITSFAAAAGVSIVHEAARNCGVGAEIAAGLADAGIWHLQAPVKRVTGYDSVMPLYKMEMKYMPSVKRILNAVSEVLEVS